MGKKRTLSGHVGVGIFVLALIATVVAFCASSWLVSDSRITGAKFDRLGLWTHCFRSLPDPSDVYERRFHVGCRWVYDPFTTGYDQIRGYLMPPFIIATQFFYTLAFIGVLISFVLVLLFFLCFRPEHGHFINLTNLIGLVMLVVGLCSTIAVVVFAIWANNPGWMPGHDNNFFGWTFVLAIVGIFASFISGALFLVEGNVQRKKRRRNPQGSGRVV